MKGNCQEWRLPGVVEYELALTAGLKGKPESEGGWQRLNYSGRLSKVATRAIGRFDGARRLDSRVGPYVKKVGSRDHLRLRRAAGHLISTKRLAAFASIFAKSELANYPGQLDEKQGLYRLLGNEVR